MALPKLVGLFLWPQIFARKQLLVVNSERYTVVDLSIHQI
ncbi:hypothetical protein HMPREF0539_1603 [Lacticaseibacillus rhamnosus LMS2-1]|uniref:Uncharacterized protein n=1 Tax=Lacticaseibacillus rhamnosus (strain LMS2-1) TaxID=525361 RepID=C2JXG9_LACRM|nr:hypothetical protein HMPREF0539_1603 [Lacticaseibacillus rhamnosus LMS2-1]